MGFFSEPVYTPEYEVAGDEVAVFDTSKGTIRVDLDGEGAPIHVA
ncbi:MAG: peptidylprolyl isomerase, partial [Olsenella umbonata]|nr:peptidylprolyl isomerase [Parafannyhessea umbonata]